jgi:hypothetical protein
VEGRWPRSVTGADLADTIGMRDREIVAHRLATPLVQAFGVPRPPWLDEDGTLRSFYMLREGKRAFEDGHRTTAFLSTPRRSVAAGQPKESRASSCSPAIAARSALIEA